MPFAGLRKRRSLNADNFPHPEALNGVSHVSQNVTESPILRPKSATSSNWPLSLPHTTAEHSTVSLQNNPNTLERPFLNLTRNYHASDSQLSARFNEHDGSKSSTSDWDPAPALTIRTSNSSQDDSSLQRKSRKGFTSFTPQNYFRSRSYNSSPKTTPNPATSKTKDASLEAPMSLPSRPGTSSNEHRQSTFLRQEVLRNDEYLRRRSNASSRSRSQSRTLANDRKASASTAAFFRFARRKKQDPAFSLPVHISPPPPDSSDVIAGYDTSQHVASPNMLASEANSEVPTRGDIRNNPAQDPLGLFVPSNGRSMVSSTSILGRRPSSGSAASIRGASPIGVQARSRSGTLGSFQGRKDLDQGAFTSTQDSGRNSEASTTVGRNSIAGFRSLTSRLRQPSEPRTPHRGSPGSRTPGTPHGNSFALSRETLVIPEREEGETAGKYFSRLENDIPKKSIALVLAKSTDNFSHDVLRSLMRSFKFYEEPMDIALRRLLWEIDLPGEAQQIDRVMSAFAERYHECNPHIFNSFDDAYLIAYSLIILHSDLFNKNNKHKMLRFQYQRNTSGHGIPDEILGYFYDNISYTEFIAQNPEEEDLDKKSKMAARRAKKLRAQSVSADTSRYGKLDPYDVIIDNRLKFDILRPALKDELSLEDTYKFLGTAKRLDMSHMRAAFSRFGILQLVSARSRPEAFTSPSTITNPNEAHPGVVNMKIAKVGILWRKDTKRKKGRSPWQEWGAILSQSQLFFFKNSNWIKSLIHQAEAHQKHNGKTSTVIFKPPLEDFKYDLKVATSGAVALVDSNYKRHKHAFTFARRGDASDETALERYFEETVLADNENDLNDWLAKLNYAAAFSTSNVRMQSWHPSNLKLHASLSASSHSEPSSPRLSLTSQNEANMNGQLKTIRRQLASRKVSAVEEDYLSESKVLDDYLRTARHLQILAPFGSKTRSDLLVFGARTAHNIRWSRFNLARLRCQKLILNGDLELDGITPVGDPHINPMSTVPQSHHSAALGASANLRSSSSKAKNSRDQSNAESDSDLFKGKSLIDGIDKAFATPIETLSSFAASGESSLKLLPLNLDNKSPMTSTVDTNDTPDSLKLEVARPTSRPTSRSSNLTPNARLNEVRAPSESSVSLQSIQGSERPLTALDSDKEQARMHNSPENRSRARRSLQKTLREPRDALVPQHNRSRKGKDPLAGFSGDDISSRDTNVLARSPGSFTIHGKKASVITLGSEWQNISAEERLKARKQAQSDDQNLFTGTSGALQEGEGQSTVEPNGTELDSVLSNRNENTDETVNEDGKSSTSDMEFADAESSIVDS